MANTPSTVSNVGSDIFDAKFLTSDGFHCDFHMQGGDVVLVSSDHVKFQTHSFTLSVASAFFRKALSLPRESAEFQLPEDAQTICTILRMVSGMEIPRLENFDELEKVLFTAKKWEMPGPPSIIYYMSLPQSLLDDPVRLYSLACKVGWREAIYISATHTLDVDLGHEEIVPLLRNMASADVLKLMDLRTRRRDTLLEFLLSYTVPGCLSHLPHSKKCSGSAEFSIQWQWKAFMFTVFIAMDRHPSGKTLLGPNSFIQADLEDMRNTRCPDCEDVPAFDVDHLLRTLEKKVAELPKTICD